MIDQTAFRAEVRVFLAEKLAPERRLASARYFDGRAASIHAGSNQIWRGIIARRVVGI
jgi:alkylation response protein AidB-like acyl-CoA dehydrogenase